MVRDLLKGKNVMVTGANSGIGLATSWKLAELGARVYMVARDPLRGNVALQTAKEKSGSSNIFMLIADLSSLSDVENLVKAFHKQSNCLDILINNAAIVPRTRQVSRDGIELQFAVNHLAHFMLTEKLLPLLEKSPDPRIINVSSQAHKFAQLDFNDLQFTDRPYSAMKVYGTTKLMNILYTKELSERVRPAGINVHALHPGVVATNFFRFLPPVVEFLFKPFLLSPEKGAATSVFLASSQEGASSSGDYWSKKRLKKTSDAALDIEKARQLTQVSRELCKLPAK